MRNNKQTGFTLIEIMVAVSIFVIVAFIVSSTLLTLIAASRRADKLRSIIDNVNFAMESMTQGIKFGKNYAIGGDGYFSYLDKDEIDVIYGLSASESITAQKNGDAPRAITSPEAKITELKFYETSPIGSKFKSILIKIRGQALVKKGAGGNPDDLVDFTLQTTVSQDISSSGI